MVAIVPRVFAEQHPIGWARGFMTFRISQRGKEGLETARTLLRAAQTMMSDCRSAHPGCVRTLLLTGGSSGIGSRLVWAAHKQQSLPRRRPDAISIPYVCIACSSAPQPRNASDP